MVHRSVSLGEDRVTDMSGVAGPCQPKQLKQRAVPVMASQSEKVCPSCRHCAAGSATTWRMEEEDC